MTSTCAWPGGCHSGLPHPIGRNSMLSGLITIAGGILAASSLIIARKPNAKDLIDKLTPYQGWIGIVMFFWGVWGTFQILTNLGFFLRSPLFGAMAIAATAAELVVGFLL